MKTRNYKARLVNKFVRETIGTPVADLVELTGISKAVLHRLRSGAITNPHAATMKRMQKFMDKGQSLTAPTVPPAPAKTYAVPEKLSTQIEAMQEVLTRPNLDEVDRIMLIHSLAQETARLTRGMVRVVD